MTTLSFEALWRDRGATAGLKSLAGGTKAARQGFEDLRAAAVRAAGALKKSQLDAADAARMVAVQEARLAEARASASRASCTATMRAASAASSWDFFNAPAARTAAARRSSKPCRAAFVPPARLFSPAVAPRSRHRASKESVVI